MSDQTIFEGAPTTNGSTSAQPDVSELVGEGKKYKTVEDALKALPHAQNHISVLESENAELRKKLEMNQESVDEILTRLREADRPKFSRQETEPETKPDVPVERIVEELLTKREKQSKIKHNLDEADKLMKAKFGTKAVEVLSSKANELGVSVDTLAGIASQSPRAFMEYFKEHSSFNPNHTSSTVNSESLEAGSNNGGARGKSYWDNLRRTNYNEYMTPRNQDARASDRHTLGKRYDTL